MELDGGFSTACRDARAAPGCLVTSGCPAGSLCGNAQLDAINRQKGIAESAYGTDMMMGMEKLETAVLSGVGDEFYRALRHGPGARRSLLGQSEASLASRYGPSRPSIIWVDPMGGCTLNTV